MLPSGSEIIINPSGTGEYILTISQTISLGAILDMNLEKIYCYR
jgi:hypothetical protein